MITLTRPLCFIDFESTGVDTTTDRIVEIAILKYMPDGEKKIFTTRVNPTIPIPAESTEIHHITDEDVKDCKTFKEIAPRMHSFIKDCDLAGYNSNQYDFPLLFNEFARAGIDWQYQEHTFVDIGTIHKRTEPRTLVAAYKQYFGIDLEEAHSAEADIKATAEVFEAQLDKFPEELKGSLEDLALYSNYDKPIADLSGKFSVDKDGEYIYNFGQHKGKKVKDQMDFLNWMLNIAPQRGPGFAADTVRIGNKIWQQVYAPTPSIDYRYGDDKDIIFP
jgi:DNA polymerase-3 subunit epsilon